MDRHADVPRAVLGVASTIRGSGAYRDGVEQARIRVTLASAVPRELCERLGLGYADPATLHPDAWRDRDEEGILFVERAGETLYVPEDWT